MEYLIKVFRRNWKGMVVGAVIIFVIGLIFKNVGEAPYENQYMMDARLSVEFDYQDTKYRGFVFLIYWVTTTPQFNTYNEWEQSRYIENHGQVRLDYLHDELITELKRYSRSEKNEVWIKDSDFFSKRNMYYVGNDPKLLDFFKKQEFDINLPYQVKKAFFVYMSDEENN